MPPSLSDVETMKAAGDTQSLIKLLSHSRSTGAAGLRAAAASALGELHDVEATEVLIQAILSDPSEEVRAAASDALKNLLGGQAEAALENYAQAMPETPVPPSGDEMDAEEDDLAEDEDEKDTDLENDVTWDQADLEGLINVLTDERDPELKIRACAVLAKITDMRAAQALATASLADDEPELQEAARAALESMLGESAQSFINSLKLEEKIEEEDDLDTEDETEPDDSEEEDDEVENDGTLPSPYLQASPDQPSVFEDEGRGFRRWFTPALIVMIILLALIALRYIFF